MEGARLFVLVQDPQHNPLAGLEVRGRMASERRFRPLRFDKFSMRYIFDEVEPGTVEIEASSPNGAAKERCSMQLEGGDQHLQMMLGEPGMMSFDAAGTRYYFEPERHQLIFAVRGIDAAERVPEMLRRARLRFRAMDETRRPAEDVERRQAGDEAMLLIELGDAPGEVHERLIKVRHEMIEHGMTVRMAVPVRKNDEMAFGLTNEIIVRFAPELKVEEVLRVAARFGLEMERNIAYLGNAFLFIRPGIPMAEDLIEVLDALAKDDKVLYAQPNILQRLRNFLYNPNDYLYPAETHLQLIRCGAAWESLDLHPGVPAGGHPDITIAVLDIDGVDPTHPDLVGTLSDGTQKMVADFDFVNMATQIFANLPGDHGTQCASSATARMDNNLGVTGVAPNCHLIGGRMSGMSTNLEIADMWVWMAGFPTGSTHPSFPAQLAKGADVISNSWGPSWAPPNQVLRDAFDFLTTYGRGGRGCTVCFAAGNYGYSLVDNRNPYAADAKTLCIGASINSNPTSPTESYHADPAGQTTNLTATVDTRSFFSPYGLTIDLVAPSHTAYEKSPPNALIDPIMAAVRTDTGEWPGSAVAQTQLTGAVAAGATVLTVASSAGFAVGEYALLGGPGGSPHECRRINAVAAGQLTIDALENGYGVATTVTTGPNDYEISFGGTSHSCPTVAGAAALLLSVHSDLTWIEVRRLLRESAVHIDAAQADATGQWVDLDGDGTDDFSQWYGYGRLDVGAAVEDVIHVMQRADVVIRDNLADTGAVPSTGWHAASPDVWVRRNDDPIPALAYAAAPPHEVPKAGQDNYVFLRVKNNGTAVATTLHVRAMIAHFPGIEFRYPEDWQPTPGFGSTPSTPLQPGTYLIGESQITNLAVGGETIVKMRWDASLVPPQTVMVGGSPVQWHPCLLAEVSPHDGPAAVSNFYPVKGDNNLAHRNLSIDYSLSSPSAPFLTAVVAGTRFGRGVEALVFDRSRLAPETRVMVGMADVEMLRPWLEMVEKGEGFETFPPLGEIERDRGMEMGEHMEPFSKLGHCEVTLLDAGRFSVPCGEGCTLVVHAAEGTRLETLFTGRERRVREGIELVEHEGRKMLRLDRAAECVRLPMHLAAGQFAALLIGFERPEGADGKSLGALRISQMRGDGEISAGYEILA